MPNATLTGNLYVQPSDASGSFPAGATTIPLALSPSPKSLAVDTGVVKRTVTSSSSPATLSGVGAADTVTQGSFLYLRSNAPMLVTLTQNNPAGGTTVAVLAVGSSTGGGLLVMEFDPTRYLVGLSAQGSGTIEYLVGGPQ